MKLTLLSASGDNVASRDLEDRSDSDLSICEGSALIEYEGRFFMYTDIEGSEGNEIVTYAEAVVLPYKPVKRLIGDEASASLYNREIG